MKKLCCNSKFAHHPSVHANKRNEFIRLNHTYEDKNGFDLYDGATKLNCSLDYYFSPLKVGGELKHGGIDNKQILHSMEIETKFCRELDAMVC